VSEEQLLKFRKSIKWIGLDTRVKDFAFRLSKGLLYSNDRLCKAAIKDSSASSWCGEVNQMTLHMLRDCPKIAGLTCSPWDESLSLHERVKAIRALQYIYSCVPWTTPPGRWNNVKTII